jgi:ferritin-like metal-binding protein YciE
MRSRRFPLGTNVGPERCSESPNPERAAMNNLEQLFEETLRDIYYAEKAILKNLPKMAKKASSEDLAAAFDSHVDQTEVHVERLEKIFEMIGKAPRGKRCPAMDGLAEEAAEVMQEAKDDTVRDAGMLAAAQSVEHYEISRYGTLAAWAEKLGMSDAVKLLESTLQEEKDTDLKLSELAMSEINLEASAGGDDKTSSRGSRQKRESGATARRA